MPLDPSCLERLLHSNFSFRAYTFKISRYCPYWLLMVAIKSGSKKTWTEPSDLITSEIHSDRGQK